MISMRSQGFIILGGMVFGRYFGGRRLGFLAVRVENCAKKLA
jgi:hypothetical protein